MFPSVVGAVYYSDFMEVINCNAKKAGPNVTKSFRNKTKMTRKTTKLTCNATNNGR